MAFESVEVVAPEPDAYGDNDGLKVAHGDQMESKISLPNRTHFETPDITPEKGDQMPTEDATPTSQNEDEFPVAVKKLQKKLQLKQLIL